MEDDWDLFSTPEMGVVKTHGPAQCVGRPCCIHDPSDHHMRAWPMTFDESRYFLANRTCEHGYMHPDPDSIGYFANRPGIHENVILWLYMHRCDGCCMSIDPSDTAEGL